MSAGTQPQLSAILATPDSYATIARTITFLCAQTAADQIELVVVARDASTLGEAPQGLDALHSVRVVECPRASTLVQARGAGIRAASAPVVVLAEDHSCPEPEWAHALITAHESDCVAVGPMIANANPASAMSWAQIFLTYGRFVEPANGGRCDDVPGHNSSYKRDVLLAYGERLDAMLEIEYFMHCDLHQRGYQLIVEPRAITRHLNKSRLHAFVQDHMVHGRIFASVRHENLSFVRRWFLAATLPFTIPQRMIWSLREILQPQRRMLCPLLRILPCVLFGVFVRCWGEMIGLCSGSGDAKQQLWDIEFRRERGLTSQDLANLELSRNAH